MTSFAKVLVRGLPRLAFARLAMTVGGSAVLLFVFRQPETFAKSVILSFSQENEEF